MFPIIDSAPRARHPFVTYTLILVDALVFPAMEARFGRLGFATLYLAGGAVASFTHLIANL